MDPLEKLNEALEKVHSQRKALEGIKQTVLTYEEIVAKTWEGRKLAELVAKKASTTTALNTSLIEAKRLTQDVAIELKDKRPHPGVLVKAKTEVLIKDEKQALFYCINHMPSLLKYDKTALKKVMKALPAEALPGFVTIEADDYATPTIVKDLSEWFELTSEEPSF